MEKETQEKDLKNSKTNSGYYGNRLRIGASRGSSWIRQQFGKGMTYFLVIAASIVFYFALLRATNLTDVFWKIIDVLKPILYGLVIAYLLNPIVKKVDHYFIPFLEKKLKNEQKAAKLSRATGIFLAIIVFFVIIIALFSMLIPELYKSVRDMVITLPGQLNDFVADLNELYSNDSAAGNLVKAGISEGAQMFQTWLRTDLLPRANDLMSSLTVGVLNILRELFNALIGVIVSVYILFSKEKFVRQTKKTVYAVLSFHNATDIALPSRKLL